MAQQKTYIAKPDNLSLVPRRHMVEKDLQADLCPQYIHTHPPPLNEQT